MSDDGQGGRPEDRDAPQAPVEPSHPGPPPAPPKKRRGLVIGLAVALLVLCGVAACASGLAGIALFPLNKKPATATKEQTLKPDAAIGRQRAAWREQLQDARKLVEAKQYPKAYDAYFAVVEAAKDDSQTAEEAMIAIALAYNQQMGPSRLPKQLEQAVALRARIPDGVQAQALDDYVKDYLVDSVASEAGEGKQFLDDRRAFIKAIRDKGNGEVYALPTKDRLLTEAEVVAAQSRLGELGVSGDVVKLYQLARPLSAAMDRFLADDSRYLGEKTVSSSDIRELESSCEALDAALAPVQRQLDRVDPHWR